MRTAPRNLLMLLCAWSLAAPAPGASPALPQGMEGLTPEELAAEPPDASPGTSSEWDLTPIEITEATDIELEVLSETGYVDDQGRYVIDLLEQDYAYLALVVTTPDGQPVSGADPSFILEGTSQLLEPEEVSARATTDEYGGVEFAVVGGQMGLDRLDVTVGDERIPMLVNVISLEAAGFPTLPELEDGLRWNDLMQAEIRYEETKLVAEFPEAVAERAGETVRVSGFMMPLDPDLEQHRFLLTSNPPSCFFHVPGGPAGAVEVFAKKGVAMTWDPVILEGRFEPQHESTAGIVYRLHDARVIRPW